MISGIAMLVITLVLVIWLILSSHNTPAPTTQATTVQPQPTIATPGPQNNAALSRAPDSIQKSSSKGHTNTPDKQTSIKTGGSNSPIVKRLEQGAGSIAQIGGSGNQARVNNFGKPTKPDRRIKPQDRDALVAYLAQYPAKVGISVPSGNREAYMFAKDWYDVFAAAKWDTGAMGFYMSAGEPWVGVRLKFNGEPVNPGEEFLVPIDSPAGHVAKALEAEQVESVSATRGPTMNKDVVTITIGLNE